MSTRGGTWFLEVVRGRKPLPWWWQIAFVGIAIEITLSTVQARGWAVGALAAVTYGYVAAANAFRRNQHREWISRHSGIGRDAYAIVLPAAFIIVALAPYKGLPIAACVAFGLLGGVLTAGIAQLVRAKRGNERGA